MMRPRLEAAREVLARHRRDLRQHRRQRGRAPAAADGRGVRRGRTSSRRSWSTSTPRAASSAAASRPATSTSSSTPATPPRACSTPASTEHRRRARLPADRRRRPPLPAPAAAQHQQEVQPGHRAHPALPDLGRPRDRRVATDAVRRARSRSSRCSATARPAVWRWSRPRIDERPDDLVCRRDRGRSGERVDVFQKDWLHRDGRPPQEAAHHLAGRGDRLDRHRGRRAQGAGRPRLRVAQADRAGPPDPGDHARRRRGARLLRRQRHHRPRRRARRTPPTAAPGAASASTPPSPPARAPTPQLPGWPPSPTSPGPGCAPSPRRSAAGFEDHAAASDDP